MPEIILGQFIAKVAGGGIWSFILQRFFDRYTPEVQAAWTLSLSVVSPLKKHRRVFAGHRRTSGFAHHIITSTMLWRSKMPSQKFICPACNSRNQLIIAHIEPIFPNTITELAMCTDCNENIPAHLAYRWDGLSIKQAREKWKDYRRKWNNSLSWQETMLDDK